jgi:hypothetical protein
MLHFEYHSFVLLQLELLSYKVLISDSYHEVWFLSDICRYSAWFSSASIPMYYSLSSSALISCCVSHQANLAVEWHKSKCAVISMIFERKIMLNMENGFNLERLGRLVWNVWHVCSLPCNYVNIFLCWTQCQNKWWLCNVYFSYSDSSPVISVCVIISCYSFLIVLLWFILDSLMFYFLVALKNAIIIQKNNNKFRF